MAVQLPLLCGSNGVHIEGEEMSWLQLPAFDSTAFRLLGFNVIEQYSDPIEGTCWFTEEAQRRYGITAENRTVGTNKDGEPQFECCGIIAVSVRVILFINQCLTVIGLCRTVPMCA